LTGTCYNFEMEEFFSSFLRRTGMPASAGLSCFTFTQRIRRMFVSPKESWTLV